MEIADKMTQQKAEQKAEEINKISLDYHLTHAVFACDKLIEDNYKRSKSETASKLKNSLQEAYCKKDNDTITELLKEKKSLKLPKYHIFVDYIDMKDPEGSRVVKAEDKLIISLPKMLVDNSRNDDGSYNEEGVKKLREIMAHELGHIALHIDNLLRIDSLQGSKELDNNQENEANWFADKLLWLRHERNKKMAQCGSF
jgi:hypothetical protein